MRWRILTIGRPRLAFAREGIAEYLPRFHATTRPIVEHLRPRAGETESALLLRTSTGALRVVLDESGSQLTSRQLAERFGAWELLPQKELCFLIGGADGHAEELVQAADFRWSLGKLTLQHELALVVLLEQLYRATCIRNGSPYHRD